MPFDSGLIGAIHLEQLRRAEAAGDEASPHVVFQASTIDALLDGAYDGDLTFGELAEHGDLGLGTTQALDGEMIGLDGHFYRADASGAVRELDPATKTPFAVVVPFSAERELEIPEPLDLGALYARVEEAVPESGGCVALRLDGRLRWVRLRSVHPQEPPYPPLAEALEQQVVYELHDASGTIVGFRFPQAAQGIEVPGYHLHFITDDRRRGGHVLDLRGASGRMALDRASELHLELPRGTWIRAADPSAGKRELLDRLEGGVAEGP